MKCLTLLMKRVEALGAPRFRATRLSNNSQRELEAPGTAR